MAAAHRLARKLVGGTFQQLECGWQVALGVQFVIPEGVTQRAPASENLCYGWAEQALLKAF